MSPATVHGQSFDAQAYLVAGLRRLAEKYGPGCAEYHCDIRGEVSREEIDRILGDLEEEITEASLEAGYAMAPP
jgi:hypothetical protein